MRLPALFQVLLIGLGAGCDRVPSMTPEQHAEDVLAWREWRLADVTSEDSWLTLVGYEWLSEGSFTIGSGDAANIRLPRGPEVVGRLLVHTSGMQFIPTPGVEVTADGEPVPVEGTEVFSNRDGRATILRTGSMNWFVRYFQDRLAVRVRDNDNPLRTDFPGLDYFPVNGDWRLDARYVPYDPPKRFPVAIFTGGDDLEESPGAVVFEVEGITYRLDVTDTSDTGYFVIFADESNRDDTYPAGRYVWFDRPEGESGPVVLDFNKAYNPPCAFTEFATCPLPPRSHHIAARIEAGELRFASPDQTGI